MDERHAPIYNFELFIIKSTLVFIGDLKTAESSLTLIIAGKSLNEERWRLKKK